MIIGYPYGSLDQCRILNRGRGVCLRAIKHGLLTIVLEIRRGLFCKVVGFHPTYSHPYHVLSTLSLPPDSIIMKQADRDGSKKRQLRIDCGDFWARGKIARRKAPAKVTNAVGV